MRIMLTIEYDGTAYSGWQLQEKVPSVQGEIEKVLKTLTGHRIVIHGAGRTDKGVHAFGQVAHFDIESTIPPEKFSIVLNTLLPADIRIVYSEKAEPDLHARYNAKGKQYVYQFYNAPHASALYRNTTMHIPQQLNIDAMKQAAAFIVGTYDFSAFCAAGSIIKNKVRTVSTVEIDAQLPFIKISVTGNGFLYNMVRIIAGTLVEVGKGKIAPEQLPLIIESRDRRTAGMTAEPQGLVLYKVFY